jgi:cyclic pyranopterin phosphate synthase
MTHEFSHLDKSGNIQMVDISDKNDSQREAIACGEVLMSFDTLKKIQEGVTKKGNVLLTAQLAGIMAAKRTSEIIPLCHFIPITYVDVNTIIDENLPGIIITSIVKTFGRTGVEMEALTAVTVAALTIYDMVKALEKTIRIQNIRLLEKHGGRSGDSKYL